MSVYVTDKENYKDIANAIRSCNGTLTKYKPSQMAKAIQAIGMTNEKTVSITTNGSTVVTPNEGYSLSKVTINTNVTGGATPVIEPLTVNENGVYTIPAGKDGYSPVTVNVPQIDVRTQTKNMHVNTNGISVVVPDEGYLLTAVQVYVNVPQVTTQEKSLSITSNGTYTVNPDTNKNLSKVTVTANIPTEAVVTPLTVTENGTYTPPSGTHGYSPVTVAIPKQEKTVSITENGTTVVNPDTGYDISKVTITTNVPTSAVVAPISITENGTYTPPEGTNGYSPVTVNVPQTRYDWTNSFQDTVYTEGVIDFKNHLFKPNSSGNVRDLAVPKFSFASATSWEIGVVIKAGANYPMCLSGTYKWNYYQDYPSIEIKSANTVWFGMSLNGSSWDISETITTTESFSANHYYYVYFGWNGEYVYVRIYNYETEALIGEYLAESATNPHTVSRMLYDMSFGNNADQSTSTFKAIPEIDLSNMYVKMNGSIIRGLKTTTLGS